MSKKYALAAVTIGLIILCLSGCTSKVYVYDFAAEDDLQREDGNWELRLQGNPSESSHDLDSMGVILDGYFLFGPHKYTEDFTMTVDFLLNVSSEDFAHCWIFLGNNLDTTPYLSGLLMAYLGYDPDELAYIFDGFGELAVDAIDPIPELYRNGPNKFVITRRGERFSYVLNGKTLASNIVLVNNTVDEFIPIFMGIQEGPIEEVHSLIFQRIEIRYSGEQMLR